MKLLSKIKAFFQYRGQQAELDVSAAEIKNGRVYLHPKDNPSKVYCIRSNAVDILISPRENICEEDLEILEIKKPESAASSGETQIDPTPAPSTVEAEQSCTQSKASIRPRPLNAFYQPMKRITFTMYPEEYDMFMSSMQKDGFKKRQNFFWRVSAQRRRTVCRPIIKNMPPNTKRAALPTGRLHVKRRQRICRSGRIRLIKKQTP